MTWLREKAPEKISADALAMARRKQRAGCKPCVEAYVDLARRHGATDDEIRRALDATGNETVSERRR